MIDCGVSAQDLRSVKEDDLAALQLKTVQQRRFTQLLTAVKTVPLPPLLCTCAKYSPVRGQTLAKCKIWSKTTVATASHRRAFSCK